MDDDRSRPTRRAFLKAAGVALLSLAAGYPLVRALFREPQPIEPAATDGWALPSAPPWPPAGGRERRIRLVVTRDVVRLPGGPSFLAFRVNGRFPAPEIRATEGDRLIIDVVNRTDAPLTFHWHGVHTPPAMDGVPFVSQEPIPPGETFVYSFIAAPRGTRWYHAHVDEVRQIPLGLFGPFIIDPPAGEAEGRPEESGGRPWEAEAEAILMLHTLGPDPENNPVGALTEGSGPVGGMGGMMGGPGRMGGMVRMGGMGGGVPPNLLYLVNGLPAASFPPLRVPEGGRLRLRLINASATEPFWLEAPGAHFLVDHVDGNALPEPVPFGDLFLAPAERIDAWLVAGRSGTFAIRSKIPGQEALRISVEVAKADGESITPSDRGGGSHLPGTAESWSYWALAGGAGTALPAVDRVVPMVLSGGMMTPVWTINGEAYPRVTPTRIGAGERVRLELFNHSMVDHPMHLHGHTFWVTSIQGVPLRRPIPKDTVNVRPMERMTIDFVANNPGRWLFHCHQLVHMEQGMATLIDYRKQA
ncbi:MAG: multicopper oxidase family protein [Hydrogenibacillus schlegelii]|uniref:Multicopper oxidase family protein n=1 Tax=Hydrogenibacillus schlegelii TaxID=1484 RepID=A0A947CVW4_HYDSH|nr:multicopper oxidase family protein [Hydrogenibacillus schlegelii]